MSGATGLEAHPVEVPPGYPREFERRLRLRDGREVFVRPVIPADRDRLAEAIRSADPQTLRRRFLGAPPPLTTELLTRLTTLDYRRRFALAAADATTGQGVAIARFESLEEGVAEVALAVDPAWRRAGLATVLVELLARAAVDRGVHTFTAMYLADNRPVATLLGHADGEGRRLIYQGLAEASVALDRDEIAQALREVPEA